MKTVLTCSHTKAIITLVACSFVTWPGIIHHVITIGQQFKYILGWSTPPMYGESCSALSGGTCSYHGHGQEWICFWKKTDPF